MSYQALVVNKSEDDFSIGVEARDDSELPEGEVTIAVDWSDVNYKDALASTANGRVVTKYPLVLGIDLAGTVQASSDAGFRTGDRVVAIGYDIGTGHDGGYADLARLPAKWVAKLPDGLSSEEAMALGTAGFTAAMSVDAIQTGGVSQTKDNIAITIKSYCQVARSKVQKRACHTTRNGSKEKPGAVALRSFASVCNSRQVK